MAWSLRLVSERRIVKKIEKGRNKKRTVSLGEKGRVSRVGPFRIEHFCKKRNVKASALLTALISRVAIKALWLPQLVSERSRVLGIDEGRDGKGRVRLAEKGTIPGVDFLLTGN